MAKNSERPTLATYCDFYEALNDAGHHFRITGEFVLDAKLCALI